MSDNFSNTDVQNHDLEHFYGLTRGYKFDGVHMNWMLMNNYIALPFSYMNFVIQESHFKKEGQLEYNVFDIDAYNYLFNGSSSLINMLSLKKNLGK